MKTLLEIKNEVTRLIQPLIGSKVKSWSQDFHNKIAEIVNSFLAQYELEYRPWCVVFKKSIFFDDNDFIFRLDMPGFIKEDNITRAYAINPMGKIVNIQFDYAKDYARDDMTIIDYIRVTEIKVIEEKIKKQQDHVYLLNKDTKEALIALGKFYADLQLAQRACRYNNKTIAFKDLKEGQKFMFPGETELRYACQVGKSEIYCPKVGQNTMGHSMSSGDEVFLKSDKPVILVQE